MATYVNNLRLKEIATGDEDGTWGTSTNTNLELIGEGFGYGTQEVAADANETFTMADGAADGVRGMYLKFTSAGSLSATRELTLAPNTVSKVWIIENATTGSQIITIKQGAGATINIASGAKKMVYTDGAGSGAAVFDANPTEVGGTVTSVQVAGGTTGLTYSGGPITASGTITTAGTLVIASGGTGSTSTTYCSLTANVSGTLPIANGGTNSTSTTYCSLTANVSGTLPIANGGTNSTSTTYCSLTANVSGTLPVANGGTGITSLGTGVAAWWGTPSSANLATAVTDETGSGSLVFATSPTFVTPTLGTPDGGTLTNVSGLPPAGVVGTAAILGANTFTALQTEAAGADIASATATDLTAATGNVVVITGTTTATSLTMTAGQQMILIAAAAWPLTFHATTMNITGGVSYTCAAGDRLYVTKDVDNVIRVSVLKQDGTSVVAGVASSVAVGNITGAGTGVLTALAVNVGSAGAPAVLNGVLGTPSSGTLSGCTVDGTAANTVGFRNIPQNSQSTPYTLVLADAGKHILHPAGDASTRTFTIPANASVAYVIGTAVTFINMTSQVVTIAITSDTMYLSDAGTTGSRSLAQYGSATAIKITATNWVISGSGLT